MGGQSNKTYQDVRIGWGSGVAANRWAPHPALSVL